MPTLREILYAIFILCCLALGAWFVLEVVDRINEGFIRPIIGG